MKNRSHDTNTQDDAPIAMPGKRLARATQVAWPDGDRATCDDAERRVAACFRDAARSDLLWFTDADIDAFARWAGAPQQWFYLRSMGAATRQRVAAWYVVYRALGASVAPRCLPMSLAVDV